MVESSFDVKEVREAARNLIRSAGKDPDGEVLRETWRRRVPGMWKELTKGYREGEKPNMKTFESDCDDMVIKRDISFYSLCEHHLLPFHGVVHVGYIPDGQIVGISKIARYVRWRSSRFQIQERLTNQIADGLVDHIEPTGLMVITEAIHLCEAMRGVREPESETIISAIRGSFKDEDSRQRDEFQRAIRNGS